MLHGAGPDRSRQPRPRRRATCGPLNRPSCLRGCAYAKSVEHGVHRCHWTFRRCRAASRSAGHRIRRDADVSDTQRERQDRDSGCDKQGQQDASGHEQLANPGESGAMVMDGAAHTRMMVMDQQQKYIVVPESMAGAMDGMGKGADAANAPKFTFTKTGRTETVAGVSCQVIHGTGTSNGKAVEGDMCVAKGAGINPATWAHLGGRMGAGNSPWGAVSDELGPGNGILKLTASSAGQPGFSFEATKIDRSPVSDDAFSPPAGYTQVQMPGGMGGGTPR